MTTATAARALPERAAADVPTAAPADLPLRRGPGEPSVVIPDANRSLGRFLAAEVIGDAPVAVSFEPPNRPWIQQLRAPSLDCFLFDVKENVARRDVMAERQSGPRGAARVTPPRWFDLHYSLTVWGLPVPLEHHVLSSVLAATAGHEVLPTDYVVGDLAAQGRPVFLTAAAGMKRPMLPIVSGDLKVSVEVSLTVAIPSYVEPVRARAVDRPVRVTLTDGQRRETRQLALAAAKDDPAAAPQPPEGGAPTDEPADDTTGVAAELPRGAQARARLAAALAEMAARARAAREQAAQAQTAQAQAAQAQAGQPIQPAQPGGQAPTPGADALGGKVAALLAQAAQVQAQLGQAQALLAQQLAAASKPAPPPAAAGTTP